MNIFTTKKNYYSKKKNRNNIHTKALPKRTNKCTKASRQKMKKIQLDRDVLKTSNMSQNLKSQRLGNNLKRGGEALKLVNLKKL